MIRDKAKTVENDINRSKTFSGTRLNEWTFDKDDDAGSYTSKSLRRYADNFKGRSDKWLLIYGGSGAGKTFYASCVANRLLSRGYSVMFKTAAEIEDRILSAKDKEAAYDEYKSHDILVIDNLYAADRRTDFSFKVANRIIEDIYKANKTLIVTTTMTDAETGNPPDDRMYRAMSMIWERGLPFKVSGKDRRQSWRASS